MRHSPTWLVAVAPDSAQITEGYLQSRKFFLARLWPLRGPGAGRDSKAGSLPSVLPAALAAARLLSPPRDDLLVDTRGARLVHRAAGDELRAPRLADSRTRRSSPPRAPPVAGFPAPGPPAQGSGPGLSALPLSRSTLQPGRRFPSARRSVASIALLVDTTQTFATAPCASVSPPARWEEPPLPTCVSGQV